MPRYFDQDWDMGLELTPPIRIHPKILPRTAPTILPVFFEDEEEEVRLLEESEVPRSVGDVRGVVRPSEPTESLSCMNTIR